MPESASITPSPNLFDDTGGKNLSASLIPFSLISLSWRKVGRIAPAVLLGLLLITLAYPRLMGAMTAVTANPTLERIRKYEPVTPKDLSLLITTQEQSLGWWSSPRRWADLGLATLMLANRTADDTERKTLYRKADAALRQALSRAPSNAFAWSRLGFVDMKLNGPSPASAHFLRLAIEHAPHNPKLAFTRLELCLIAWKYFEKSDHGILFDQIRFAWKLNPKRLARVAHRLHRTGPVRAALINDEASLERFFSLLSAYKKAKP